MSPIEWFLVVVLPVAVLGPRGGNFVHFIWEIAMSGDKKPQARPPGTCTGHVI